MQIYKIHSQTHHTHTHTHTHTIHASTHTHTHTHTPHTSIVAEAPADGISAIFGISVAQAV